MRPSLNICFCLNNSVAVTFGYVSRNVLVVDNQSCDSRNFQFLPCQNRGTAVPTCESADEVALVMVTSPRQLADSIECHYIRMQNA